jgi:hypothetical protein
MPDPVPKLAIGTTVVYKPKRPDFFGQRFDGRRAVLTRYSRSKQGGCFIELPSGSILHVPESDLEPDEAAI